MTIQPSIRHKLATLSKGNDFVTGLFFLILGIPISVVFLSKADVKSLSYINQELIQSSAVVINIKKTNTAENDESILEYQYKFLESDSIIVGSSYSSNATISLSDTVSIEYVKNDIATSRIIGMRNAPFALYNAVFVILFPLIGVILIERSVKKLSKYLMILEDFSFTVSELISKVKTKQEENDETVYKIKYKYQKNSGINTFETTSPEKFLEKEALIYSNKFPEQSVLLKRLSNGLQTEIKKMWREK